MGKSNKLNYKFKKVYYRDDNLNHFLKEDNIRILEKINDCFVKNFIGFFSNFIKHEIKLVEYNFKIESYNFQDQTSNNIQCCNLIETFPYQDESFIIFYNNFLSVIVDFLFGGRGVFITKNKKMITDTDLMVNKKIITFITSFLSDIYRKYFCTDINFINQKIFFNKNIQPNFGLHAIFLINRFNLHINDIEIFFDILIPEPIIQKINLQRCISINNDEHIAVDGKKLVDVKNDMFSLQDIQDVELNITARMISMDISKDKFDNLSKGDILAINIPNKIIGYIDNQPIFFADYKRFNEQSIIFIEEFINHSKLHQEKEGIK